MQESGSNNEKELLKTISKLVNVVCLLLLVVVFLAFLLVYQPNFNFEVPKIVRNSPSETVIDNYSIVYPDSVWQLKDTSSLKDNHDAALIRYGMKLISNTQKFYGSNGSIAHQTNGLNCQNCHLLAGTKPYGNNYSAVFSTYPKFRDRSGSIESISKRVNDCFERSLNGKALDTLSKEMKAILAYIKYLGKDVEKGVKPKGSGLLDVKLLDRAANPENGKIAYRKLCSSCHGDNGQGTMDIDQKYYQYPPLWGNKSYNVGAGLYRISKLAAYIKANMPNGINYMQPQLTDEEAWDIAAFINSMPHPAKDISKDWPDISTKPIDHPFGPYNDGFSEKEHKYGPFKPIIEKRKQLKKIKAK